MSSSGALVRFPDGEVRHAVYHATVDLLCPGVFATSEESWAGRAEIPVPDGPREAVEVWTSYGGGMWWSGHAWRNVADIDTTDPWNQFCEYPQKRKGPKTVIYDGTPDWVNEFKMTTA